MTDAERKELLLKVLLSYANDDEERRLAEQTTCVPSDKESVRNLIQALEEGISFDYWTWNPYRTSIIDP